MKWISVGFFSLRCFFARLLLSDLDECEVTLVLEIEKDSDSVLVLRFERVSNGDGIVEDIVGPFAVGPPTRVLVPCPAALLQSSCKELIDARACVSIGIDMVGAQVVLKDVIGCGKYYLERWCRERMEQRLIRLTLKLQRPTLTVSSIGSVIAPGYLIPIECSEAAKVEGRTR